MASISVEDSVSKTFAKYQDGSIRCLQVIQIDQIFKTGSIIPKTNNPEDDFRNIVEIVKEKPGFYFIYTKDIPNSVCEWLFMSFVPDTLSIREKFLYSSSKTALKAQIGSSHFDNYYHVTDILDLSYANLVDRVIKQDDSDFLTPLERERKEENVNVNNICSGQFNIVPFSFTNEIQKIIQDFIENSLNKVIKVEIENETYISKDQSHFSVVEDLISWLKSESVTPAFYLTNWGDGIKCLFMSFDNSPIRIRTLYSTSFFAFVNYVKQIVGIEGVKIIQITSEEELMEMYVDIVSKTTPSSMTPTQSTSSAHTSEESPVTPMEQDFSRPVPIGRKPTRRPTRRL